MLRRPDGRPVLRVTVEEIEGRGYRDLGYEHLSNMIVVRDPLPAEDQAQPGAGGHCGIEGLIRPDGVRRTDYWELLDDLATAATIVYVPGAGEDE